MENKSKEVANPCVQICTQDPDSGLCIGCSRTIEEINNWFIMTTEEKMELAKKLPKR